MMYVQTEGWGGGEGGEKKPGRGEREREKGQEITKVETNGYYRRIKGNRKSGLE